MISYTFATGRVIGFKYSLVVTAEADGKTSVQITTSTETVKVLKEQVLEVRNIGGRLRIAKKVRRYDVADPYVPPYDPYGPGEFREFIDEPTQAPAESVTRSDAE